LRILFLTTELPWPLDGGGKLRTFETLACLSRFAEVRVVSMSEAPASEADRSALEAALPGVAILPPIPHPIRIRRRPLDLARAGANRLLHMEPYLAAKFRSRAYQRLALEEGRTFRPDVVWCDHLNVWPTAVRARAGAALVLDEHNVESDLFRLAAGAGSFPLRLVSRVEGRAALSFERSAVARADRVVAISGDDARRLRDLGGADRVVVRLPSMGELPAAPPPPPPPTDAIGFLGTLSWPPNAEAVAFLAREVAPALAARGAKVRIEVGGRGLPSGVAALARCAGLTLRGFVDDAEAWLRGLGTAIVPLRSGSGIAMKLLDAMRAGVPVVATSAGARGLAVRDGEELLLADDPAALTDAIVRITRDEGLRRRLAHGAYAHLVRAHGRDAAAADYEAIARGAIRRRAIDGDRRDT